MRISDVESRRDYSRIPPAFSILIFFVSSSNIDSIQIFVVWQSCTWPLNTRWKLLCGYEWKEILDYC